MYDEGDQAQGSRDFTIAELAAEFQLTYRALRFYESRQLLAPQHRAGRRIYSQQDRESLKLLVWGKRLGLTLAEIGALIAERRADTAAPKQTLLRRDQMVDRLRDLTHRHDEIVAAIAELKRHLATLG